MSMDNEEIKRMFNGFKEKIDELKVQLKESIDEGKKDHKEIRDGISDLCDRMTKQETIHEERKQKLLTKRGWVAIVGGIVATSFLIIDKFLGII